MNSVTVSPGQMTDTLTLIHGTALGGCTDLANDNDGRVQIVRRWPNLSSGEELLWRVLGWLNGHSDLPSNLDLEAGLSVDQMPAVRTVLERNGVRT